MPMSSDALKKKRTVKNENRVKASTPGGDNVLEIHPAGESHRGL